MHFTIPPALVCTITQQEKCFTCLAQTWLSSALEEREKADNRVNQPPQDPPSAPSDPLVNTLKEAGITFTEIDRFYRVKYTFTDTKRTQLGYLRKTIYDYNSLKVQEIYSTCYESETAPSTELLQKLFTKGFSLGGLVLEAPSEKQKLWRIRYKVEAPTHTTAERLKTYFVIVTSTADALEKEISGEDKL